MAQALAPGSFYGSGEPRRFADAVFTEVAHAMPWQIPEHSHETAHFSLLLAGSSIEHAGDRTIPCRPLSMLYRHAGATHADEILPGGARFFIVELGARWKRAVDAAGDVVDYVNELEGRDPALLALRLHHIVRDGDSEAASLDVESLLYELCARAGVARPEESAEPHWLARVVRLLDATFEERHSLVSIAEAVGVHPAHLARTFRRYQRQTVGDYVSGRRVARACTLLLRGTPPSEVAQDVGFADQSHLTRTFKSLTGITPAAYRRRYQS